MHIKWFENPFIGLGQLEKLFTQKYVKKNLILVLHICVKNVTCIDSDEKDKERQKY